MSDQPEPFCHGNENWDITALLLHGRVGPREQRGFVCIEKLLGSDRDSFKTFHEVLYDFPRDLPRDQKEGGTQHLSLLFLLEGKKLIQGNLSCILPLMRTRRFISTHFDCSVSLLSLWPRILAWPVITRRTPLHSSSRDTSKCWLIKGINTGSNNFFATRH